MQLTARQREFVRIAGWVLPVSITLGAVFGHFQAQNGSIWGYVQGAVTAIVISCTILLLEFAVFSRTRSAPARRMPFLLYLMLRSLGYLAVILMGLTVSAWLLRESAERPLIERGGVSPNGRPSARSRPFVLWRTDPLRQSGLWQGWYPRRRRRRGRRSGRRFLPVHAILPSSASAARVNARAQTGRCHSPAWSGNHRRQPQGREDDRRRRTARITRNHRNVGGPRIGFQLTADVKPIHARHHHVEQDDVRQFAIGNSQRGRPLYADSTSKYSLESLASSSFTFASTSSTTSTRADMNCSHAPGWGKCSAQERNRSTVRRKLATEIGFQI